MMLHFTDAKDVFALLKGRDATDSGSAQASGEEPTFTWFKAGQEFDPEDRFKVKGVRVNQIFHNIEQS